MKTLITAATLVLFTSTVAVSHTRPEARPTDCDSAIPYPGWAQVDRMYSRDNGTFFKATADDEGITHTRYTSDCVVSSVTFSPFDTDNGSSDTESAIAALVASGMSRADAEASVAASEAASVAADKAKKDKKAKGNCGNQEDSGGGNGNGNTCGS